MSTQFLLKPISLHGFSVSLHLLLFLALFVTWVRLRFHVCLAAEGSKDRIGNNNKALLFKVTLFCCSGVSLYNLVLCLLSYFIWNGNGWSDENLVTLLDFMVRTLGWGALGFYLHTQFTTFSGSSFPILLRVWLGFYSSISGYSLFIDIFTLFGKQIDIPIQYSVSDAVSLAIGLLLCYVGFSGKVNDYNGIKEPLLNGDSADLRGDETITPYSSANVFSLLSFTWIGPLISAGKKKTLDLQDVPQLGITGSVIGSFSSFRNKLYSDSCTTTSHGVTTPKLVKALIFSTWREIFLTAFLAMSYTIASYVGPLLIDTFVQYLNGQKKFEHEGYFLVSAFFVAKLVECLAQRQWFFKRKLVGIKIRTVLVGLIYNKGLTLSCQSRHVHTSGEIINFMTVDAERVGDFSSSMHDPWVILVQVVLALLILYKNLGLASIAAFVSTVIIMLANIPLGSVQEKFQGKLMESKDKRMKETSEVLRNMRILKLQGWEMKFLSKIFELRKTESRWLKKYAYSMAIAIFVFLAAPAFISAISFGVCVLMGIPLESGKILSALATFRILQEPIYNLPETISMIAQTKVSLDRIASYLRLGDLNPYVIDELPSGSSDAAIEIVAGNFSWDLYSPNPTLKHINIKLHRGTKVAVCGTVGSGKSSLLSCILGEIPKLSGDVKLCGTRAYVAQSPWIQSGKIEENILFGKQMDREKYERVLETCSFKKDLEVLPYGDQTVIGERGINLSGGQKQRVQLARALYQDADIYLLDDPFSAVDAHTGTHLFKECLLGVLNSKTVIYVTHQVEFLPAADLILVMKDGMIMEAGKYDDILKPGTYFMELVGAHNEALAPLDSLGARPASEETSVQEEDFDKESTCEILKKESNDVRNIKADEMVGQKGQLVQAEEREKGRVGFSVYWTFITMAYGGALVPFILLMQILFQLLQIVSNYWMAWATSVSKDVKHPVGGSTLIVVYVGLAVGSSFCALARTTVVALVGLKTATQLFNNMHSCIFRAPMSFFDATPCGRILNRASTDQSVVDTDIPYRVAVFAFSMIQLFGVIAVMSQVAWQIFVIFIPVIAICLWYQQTYIPAARELSRLVGVCKAPVIQHFAETISGSTTIRSFDHESKFEEANMKLMDAYNRPMFHNAAATEWLCFRMDMLSSITFAFFLVFLISVPEKFIDPAIAGLGVTYGLNLNMLQAWVIMNLCKMENKIISVERMLQYSSIPSEPPLVVQENRPDSSWPSCGEVVIRDLQVRYAPHLPLVLRGLTCTFPGGLRTGIVGRTGSGKSTLIQTLFRIIEPAAGQIMIDNINISSIGLHDLRLRLSIIPQDPTMFHGTIRSNLDPLGEYTDKQIYEALDKCQLGEEVRAKEGKLDSNVCENGENWSMGQRQLVCLGRVLLKKSKILVLDEATASVDTTTDNLIQQTLKQHMTDCTVITIAHRITSVLDSNMVLLLNQGLVAEYDSPTRLLENNSSLFGQLVMEYTSKRTRANKRSSV